MAESVEITPDASPVEGFQTLGPKDLSDLESAAFGRGSAAASSEPTPPAVSGALAQTGTGATPADPAEAFGGGPAVPAGGTAAQPPGASAEPQSPPRVLTEAPARLRNTAQGKSGQTRKSIRTAWGILLVLALASGVLFYGRHPRQEPPVIQPRPAQEKTAVVPEKSPTPPKPDQGGGVADDQFAWEAKLREIDMLRQTLLAKKDEILLLQQNYQDGILEFEEEAALLIRRGGFQSLDQGLKSRQLELALQSIQRRFAYRDNLEKPLHWIELGSEELLYLQRRALFDLQLKDVAEHMDMTAHMADIDSALMRYEPTAEKLSIYTSALVQPSLDVIWKRLAERARYGEPSVEDQRNQDIVSEICSGNLGRLSRLSSLTLKGARCLAESDAMQLFLNRLSGMTPAAARKLREWPGQWLCLNGITRLSPELAGQLFAWPGEWMSLNGMSQLSDEAAQYLVGWKGRQLELMGLRKPTGLEFLARWEASGGRLFVPDDIRREIDGFRRAGQPPARAERTGRQ